VPPDVALQQSDPKRLSSCPADTPALLLGPILHQASARFHSLHSGPPGMVAFPLSMQVYFDISLPELGLVVVLAHMLVPVNLVVTIVRDDICQNLPLSPSLPSVLSLVSLRRLGNHSYDLLVTQGQ